MLTSSPAADGERVAACRIAECLTKPVLSGALRTALLRQLADVGPRPSDEPAEADGAGYRHRVLIVEDNPVNQMVAVGLLGSWATWWRPRTTVSWRWTS